MMEIELLDELEDKSPKEVRAHLKEFYDHAYKSKAYKPINAFGAWQRLFKYFKPFMKKKKPFKRGIEIGCGTAIGVAFAEAMGLDVFGLELADASEYWKAFEIQHKIVIGNANDLPFGDGLFDFVFIPDVMEHIPSRDVPNVLKEINRIGSKYYFFIIHTGRENLPFEVLTNEEKVKIYTHITQRGSGWWGKKLTEANYGEIDFVIKDPHVLFICSKYKGCRDWS